MDPFFLNPWYMAAGGALISSPILIHLINRMRYKRIRWAAMEFLLKSQKRNRRRLIIEQLILLLLRILLVLLAAFLLARYLYSGSTDEGGTKHFVVLDDGLSMTDHWKEDNKSVNAFGKGKEELLRIAQTASQANSAQEMIVYTLSDLETPVFDARLNTEGIEKLNQKLDALKPTVLHLAPADGLTKGGDYLRSQPQRQKILHYIGDFRESKWVSGPDGERTTKTVDQLLTSGINVSLMDVADPSRSKTKQIATSHDNLAVLDLRAETRVIAEGVPVEFTATLWNYSTSEKKTHLKVFVDGTEDFSGSKDVESIPANGKREEKFRLVLTKKKEPQKFAASDPPDERERKRRADQEFVHIGVEIHTDSLEETGLLADNFRDMVIEVRKKVPVLIIDGNDAGEGVNPGGDAFHLTIALFSAQSYETEVHKVADLEQTNLDLYPSVYLLNVNELSKPAVAKLADYVRRGGSLAYFLGPKTNVPFFNETLYKAEKGLFPVPILGATQPLTEEERVDRKQKDEQPKILFRYHPPGDKSDPKIASTDPDSVIVNLAKEQGLYRYLLIDRYFPTLARSRWEVDPDEKVRELVLLPNRESIEKYQQDAQRYINEAIALARDLNLTEKFEQALSTIYKREVRNALDSKQLFNLATAFDHTLNDIGVEGDEKKPNMKNFWAQPIMKPLRAQIERLIEEVRYGDPLVVARPYGKGRIVACLTPAGVSAKWNDWADGRVTWTYPMFMMDLQRYLTSAGDDLNHLVGDKLAYQFPAGKYSNKVEVEKALQPEPDAEPKAGSTAFERKVVRADVLMKEPGKDGGTQLEFADVATKQAGVYTYTLKQLPGEAPETRKVAFNVDAAGESDLRRASRDKLERNQGAADLRKGKLTFYERGDAIDEFKNRKPDASESPWLYLLILVVLIVEQAMAVHLSFHLRGDTPAPTSSAAPAPA